MEPPEKGRRIGSHNLPLAIACTEYAVYVPCIYMHPLLQLNTGIKQMRIYRGG
jgi:hypothetical protein